MTGSISCNPDSPISVEADYPIEVVVGPEYVTGSTRMKSGNAQKRVINLITKGVMIRLGRVCGNRMVDMQLSNGKLVDRGVNMVVEKTGLSYHDAKALLLSQGSIRLAIDCFGKGN